MMKNLVKANSFLSIGSILLAMLILVFLAFPVSPEKNKGERPGACNINKGRSSANTTSFLVI